MHRNISDSFIKTDWKIFKRCGIKLDAVKYKKITIVGFSELGMAVVLCILLRGLTCRLCYIDLDKNKIENEIEDFQNSNCHMGQITQISCGSDFALSENSDICFIAISLPYPEICTNDATDGNYLGCYEVIEKYVDVFKKYIPKLIQYNPNTALFVGTRPNSIMTYVAWRLSKLPKYRVFGIGTQDETAKYRNALATELRVASNSMTAYIIGHKFRGFPLFEGVSINGILLNDFSPNKTKLRILQKELYNKINDPDTIIKNKNLNVPCWGLALSCTHMINSILYETGEIFTPCVYAKDIYNIDKEVFISVPAILGHNGISRILTPILPLEQKLILNQLANDCHDIHINLILINEI